MKGYGIGFKITLRRAEASRKRRCRKVFLGALGLWIFLGGPVFGQCSNDILLFFDISDSQLEGEPGFTPFERSLDIVEKALTKSVFRLTDQDRVRVEFITESLEQSRQIVEQHSLRQEFAPAELARAFDSYRAFARSRRQQNRQDIIYSNPIIVRQVLTDRYLSGSPAGNPVTQHLVIVASDFARDTGDSEGAADELADWLIEWRRTLATQVNEFVKQSGNGRDPRPFPPTILLRWPAPDELEDVATVVIAGLSKWVGSHKTREVVIHGQTDQELTDQLVDTSFEQLTLRAIYEHADSQTSEAGFKLRLQNPNCLSVAAGELALSKAAGGDETLDISWNASCSNHPTGASDLVAGKEVACGWLSAEAARGFTNAQVWSTGRAGREVSTSARLSRENWLVCSPDLVTGDLTYLGPKARALFEVRGQLPEEMDVPLLVEILADSDQQVVGKERFYFDDKTRLALNSNGEVLVAGRVPFLASFGYVNQEEGARLSVSCRAGEIEQSPRAPVPLPLSGLLRGGVCLFISTLLALIGRIPLSRILPASYNWITILSDLLALSVAIHAAILVYKVAIGLAFSLVLLGGAVFIHFVCRRRKVGELLDRASAWPDVPNPCLAGLRDWPVERDLSTLLRPRSKRLLPLLSMVGSLGLIFLVAVLVDGSIQSASLEDKKVFELVVAPGED